MSGVDMNSTIETLAALWQASGNSCLHLLFVIAVNLIFFAMGGLGLWLQGPNSLALSLGFWGVSSSLLGYLWWKDFWVNEHYQEQPYFRHDWEEDQ